MDETPRDFLLLLRSREGRGLLCDALAYLLPLPGPQCIFGGLEASGIFLAFLVRGVWELIEVEHDASVQLGRWSVLVERRAFR